MSYRFPRQPYKCGVAGAGAPCANGPSGKRCGLSPEDGEHEAPCRPVRTLHWWSKIARRLLTLVALTGLLVLPNWPNKQWLAPGPLASPHAQILNARNLSNTERCAVCHPLGWTSDITAQTVSSDPHSTLNGQSHLCMNCHRGDMPEALRGSPHDLPLEQLQSLASASRREGGLLSLVSHQPVSWQSMTTQCGQCHREHQGNLHSLRDMDAASCQACHQQRFDSFATNHPELNGYPYNRPKRIAFDHLKHKEIHFTKKNSSFDCKTCHVGEQDVGAVGQVFRSVSFERACASCHDASIQSATADGWIVLQVPSIDKKQWQRNGVDIGPWPENASQLTEGSLPPTMRMLIEAQPNGAALLQRLPEGRRLESLLPTSSEDRETVAMLADVTRKLFVQLAVDGQPELHRTAKSLLASDKSSPLLVSNSNSESEEWMDVWSTQLAGGLPPDLLRMAVHDWFDIQAESGIVIHSIPEHKPNVTLASQTGKPALKNGSDDLLLNSPSSDDLLLGNGSDDSLLTSGDASSSEPSKPQWRHLRSWDQLPYGGWMVDRQRMALVYIPKGHADPFVARWIELAERHSLQGELASVSKQCVQCHTNAAQTKLSTIKLAALQKPTHRSQESHGNQASTEGPAVWLNAAWRAERRASNVHEFTRFNHTPHLSLPSLADCQSCHALPVESGSPTSMSGHEFLPLRRVDCAACHQRNAAGDACTQCHNYHVGQSALGWKSVE